MKLETLQFYTIVFFLQFKISQTIACFSKISFKFYIGQRPEKHFLLKECVSQVYVSTVHLQIITTSIFQVKNKFINQVLTEKPLS